MKSLHVAKAGLLIWLAWGPSASATDYFVSPTGGNVAPFASWDAAATNIQDAIDVASAGDVVWVTNGVYTAGGRVMGGDLTNRIALTKALVVQSVSGPSVTIIGGPGVTNGPSAVRCAWLTNNAVLSGFTLAGGATRGISGSVNQQMNGGGVWGSSLSAMVTNCIFARNTASYVGGGAYQVSLVNCVLTGNHAVGSGTPGAGVAGAGSGGGAANCSLANCVVTSNSADQQDAGGTLNCNLRNCSLTRNSSFFYGGGAYRGTLVNCTVTGNISAGYGGYGAAVASASLTNCIVDGNFLRPSGFSATNYYNCTLAYCCTDPLAAGVSNINVNPQLLADGVHLASTSPCRAAGTNIVTRTDIDGQPWANPPSIGCDEWQSDPAIGGQIQVSLGGIPLSAAVSGLVVAGQDPFGLWWLKDGAFLDDGPLFGSTHTASLTVNRFGPEAAGSYALVASNAFGMATSVVAQVVVHCADAAGTNPIAPYSTWANAATSVQDAIDAANPGEYVIVTDGVYATGGRVMAGDLTNRIAINQPLIVASINGPQSTFIQGAYDPATTTGPLSVRCAWLAQGAALRGLTLLGGATRNAGDVLALQSGGGAWCASTNELLIGCIFSNNVAAYYGGGVYQGQLQRSVLWRNAAVYGGGAYHAFLANSLVRSNAASSSGGGLHSSRLVNCSVTANLAPLNAGGGEWGSVGRNSIVFFNIAPGSLNQFYVNDWDPPSKPNLVSCWTSSSSPPGFNTTPSPQFVVDGIHLAATSPCRGAGNPLYSLDTDLDGEAWLDPPSIGCDEFYDADFRGPLSPGPISAYSIYGFGPPLSGVRAYAQTKLAGNADRVFWSFGDSVTLSNVFTFVPTHTWTNPGDYTVTFTAYNADNPAGVSTNGLVHVSLPDPPLVSNPVFTGTNFALTYTTQGGVTYVVEQTTNLAPPAIWQPVTSAFAPRDSTATVSDPNATNAAGFYRVRVQ